MREQFAEMYISFGCYFHHLNFEQFDGFALWFLFFSSRYLDTLRYELFSLFFALLRWPNGFAHLFRIYFGTQFFISFFFFFCSLINQAWPYCDRKIYHHFDEKEYMRTESVFVFETSAHTIIIFIFALFDFTDDDSNLYRLFLEKMILAQQYKQMYWFVPRFDALIATNNAFSFVL